VSDFAFACSSHERCAVMRHLHLPSCWTISRNWNFRWTELRRGWLTLADGKHTSFTL